MASICSTACAIRRLTPSGASPPSGCWTTSSGSPVAPSAVISPRARRWNTVVVIRPAGVPAFASSSESWRLHDVQEPQSADPAKTRSHSFESVSMIEWSAPVAALAFRMITTRSTP